MKTMNHGARVEFLISTLSGYIERKGPADRFISYVYKHNRFIGSRDRQFINLHFYSILRKYLLLDYLCKDDFRLQVLSYLIMIDFCDIDGLDELCSEEQYSPYQLEDREITFLNNVKKLAEDAPDNIKANLPKWLYEKLDHIEGSNLLFEEFLKEAPLDVRANDLKTNRNDLKKALKHENIESVVVESTDSGLRIPNRVALSILDIHKSGFFEIQDSGSQNIAKLVNAMPGDKIMDFCAGACGKSLAFAPYMKGKGKIVCCDISKKRLDQGKKRLKRAGVFNAECRVLDSENNTWLKRQRGKFDKVLVDAPCSGIGTIRRNPDKVISISEDMIDSLVVEQEEILKKASLMVSPGGYLIYATCSLLPEENEMQIEKFLESNDDFSLENFKGESSSVITYYPHKNDCDGFFVANLKKKNKEIKKEIEKVEIEEVEVEKLT
jgi:16S rRNA (cytosine967-C5)-methyltransferase